LQCIKSGAKTEIKPGGVLQMKTIALSGDLARLRGDLEREGFNVVDGTSAERADALVVSGMDNNAMNMEDIKAKQVVIDASGKSTGEIISELRNIP